MERKKKRKRPRPWPPARCVRKFDVEIGAALKKAPERQLDLWGPENDKARTADEAGAGRREGLKES